jgi:hypothetical protein
MLWTPQESYQEEPFKTEAELESAIKPVSTPCSVRTVYT